MADGGYLLGGYSTSGTNDNKTSPNYGNGDFWVVRLGANGNRLWDKTYGGTGDDQLSCLRPTSDGGFILGGSSDSPASGNKSAPNFGSKDFWVVKTDANGNKIWDAAFGGTALDIVFSVQQTRDGGYIVGGYSTSGTNVNKTAPNYGTAGSDGDFWVVRLDGNGTKLWDKSFGGSDDDGIYTVQELAGGGFILAGNSASPGSGTKTSPSYGGYDFWLVRLDAAGNQVWDRSFGGSADDGFDFARVLQTSDGGFIVGGDSLSPVSGNKTNANHGSSDFWVVRLDSNGNKLWDRAYGGTGFDELSDLAQTADGGFLLAGLSSSLPGDNKTSQNYGSTDFWVVRVDSQGNPLWDASFGGNSDDGFYKVSLLAASDGGWLLGGDSRSGISGNKTTVNYGNRDFWVVKLAAAPPTLRVVPQQNVAQAGFQFFLDGQPNQFYVVEYCTHFGAWIPLSTNQMIGTEISITDLGATNSNARFYRARKK